MTGFWLRVHWRRSIVGDLKEEDRGHFAEEYRGSLFLGESCWLLEKEDVVDRGSMQCVGWLQEEDH